MTTVKTERVLGTEVRAEDRPWGAYAVLAVSPEPLAGGPVAAVKILIVNPGQVLSLQTHARRSERWMAIDPGCTASIGGMTEYMVVGHTYDVPAGMMHRLANGSDKPVRIVEVMFGEYDEDDIERVEDAYGRC